jgi:hypothetical protein
MTFNQDLSLFGNQISENYFLNGSRTRRPLDLFLRAAWALEHLGRTREAINAGLQGCALLVNWF